MSSRHDAARHVTTRLADFTQGRLSDEARRAVEDHLASCEGCRAAYAWALDFVEKSGRAGLRHLSADRIVAVAGTAGAEPTEEERRHLAECEECREEMRLAGALGGEPDVEPARDVGRAAPEGGPADALPSRPKRARLISWALAGVAAAAATVLLFIGDGGVDPTELARIEPLAVMETRSADPGDAYERALSAGLASYRRREYAAAESALSIAAALREGDPEILLFLGSARLLIGSATSAVRALDEAVRSAGPGAIADEAAWQLANARLAAGDGKAAIRELESIAASDGPHRDSAGSLLHELEEAARR